MDPTDQGGGDPAGPQIPHGVEWKVDRVGWVAPARGKVTCIDWRSWLRGQTPLDPYLIWADLTEFAGFGGWDPSNPNNEHGGRLPFLIEAQSRDLIVRGGSAGGGSAHCVMGLMEVPGVYLRPRSDGADDTLASRYFTARVRPEAVAEVLKDSSCIRRMQLGIPRLPATSVDGFSTGADQSGPTPRTIIGIIDDGCAFAHSAFCSPEGETRVHFLWDQDARRSRDPLPWRQPVRLGYGGELQHADLNRFAKLAFMGQGEEMPYRQANYGPLRLDPDRAASMFSGAPGEAALPAGTMRASSHGTSAMLLAAGHDRHALDPIPLNEQRAGLPAVAPGVEGGDDYATRWPIIFVQLPTRTMLDTSGGSLGVHVLDGIRYILDRAARIPNQGNIDQGDIGQPDAGSRFPADEPLDKDNAKTYRNNKVVINVSYGALAGPHDGTSIIEQAMADLCKLGDHRDKSPIHSLWICTAAGNAHLSRTHAQLLVGAGQSKSLLWRVGPDNPRESFLEVWLPDLDDRGHAVASQVLDQVLITVKPPGGLPSWTVRAGEYRVCEAVQANRASDRPLAAVIFAPRVAQGLRGTMVLLAVGPTGARPDVVGVAALAPHGDWIVDVELPGAADVPDGPRLRVHAWTERNDLIESFGRPQQTSVVSEDPVPEPTEFTPEARVYFKDAQSWLSNEDLPNQLQPSYSLGTLAGVEHVGDEEFFQMDSFEQGRLVVAGSYRLADGEVSRYASGGPHRMLPELAAGTQRAQAKADDKSLYDNETRFRDAPDVVAPADIGPATTGLRVVGVRAGSQARLAGTSAAAPSAVRVIANIQHAVSFAGKDDDLPQVPHAAGLVKAEGAPDTPSRPTPTPFKDDRFRLGRWRVR